MLGNLTQAKEAVELMDTTSHLMAGLLTLAINIGLLFFLRWMLLRYLGVKSLRVAFRYLAMGNAARRRRVEQHHLRIRGPHYKSADDLGRPMKLKVKLEKRPADQTGGIKR